MIDDAGELLPEKCWFNLKRLDHQIEQMDRLLDDLLEYSRAGRLEEKISVVDTRRLIEEILSSLDVPAGFRIDVSNDLPMFSTLKVPLQTCLRNLIGNAIGHHDRDDGVVSISVVEEEQFYRFDISDDGPGIEAEFQDRIFKIFQTLAAKNEKSGRGVGLAVVKKTAEAYDGRVELESVPNSGTTFRLHWQKSIDDGH